jgi:hypothetical protein
MNHKPLLGSDAQIQSAPIETNRWMSPPSSRAAHAVFEKR